LEGRREGEREEESELRTDNLSSSLDGVSLLDQSIVSEDGNSAEKRKKGRVESAPASDREGRKREKKRRETYTLSASKFKHIPRTPDENSTISSAKTKRKRDLE